MKRIAIIALLVALATPVCAADLPSEMLGSWCFDKELTRALAVEGESYYYRSNDTDDCGNRGGIEIRKGGSAYCRFGCSLACKFNKIESVGGGAYHVSETCKRLRGEYNAPCAVAPALLSLFMTSSPLVTYC
jgi:hypothetical protein